MTGFSFLGKQQKKKRDVITFEKPCATTSCRHPRTSTRSLLKTISSKALIHPSFTTAWQWQYTTRTYVSLWVFFRSLSTAWVWLGLSVSHPVNASWNIGRSCVRLDYLSSNAVVPHGHFAHLFVDRLIPLDLYCRHPSSSRVSNPLKASTYPPIPHDATRRDHPSIDRSTPGLR